MFKILTRLEIVGLENVPKQGPAIIATNHMSLADPPLIFVVIKRKDVTALVTDTYKNKIPICWLVNGVRGIWINREQADLKALRRALDHLAAGGILGVAPEGTRSKVGSMIQAKTGVAYLANKAGVPVVPAAVSGSEIAFREMSRFHRPRLKLEFGHPFYLPAVERNQRDAQLERNTNEIMCRIAAMLPEKYWGTYQDNPRVAELVMEGHGTQ